MPPKDKKKKILVHTMVGEFEIHAPTDKETETSVDAKKFMIELQGAIQRHAGDVDWTGIFEFNRSDGNKLHLQIKMVGGATDL